MGGQLATYLPTQLPNSKRVLLSEDEENKETKPTNQLGFAKGKLPPCAVAADKRYVRSYVAVGLSNSTIDKKA